MASKVVSLGKAQQPAQVQAGPFIKWAGGKRILAPRIRELAPNPIKNYWEPFVGGGAVFFALADRIEHAVLSDLNEDLIITYMIVKNNVDNLMKALREHARGHKEEDYYLSVRGAKPRSDLRKAARFIYLNKTCYNGLYRVNRAGKFNVPKGSYKNPTICDEDSLRAASRALGKAEIKHGDFAKAVQPGEDDFIYCDPPYDDCFTGYQAGGFGEADQKKLRQKIDEWANAGAEVMISNSDTKMIRNLYKQKDKFKQHTAKMPRVINSSPTGRGAVNELILIKGGRYG